MAPALPLHQETRGPLHRFGDLLPLPVVREVAGDSSQLGRKCRRRICRRLGIQRDADASAAALNELAGFSDAKHWPRAPLNQAQKASVDRLWKWHGEDAQQCSSDEVALCELLKSGAGHSASAGELMTYNDGKVS